MLGVGTVDGQHVAGTAVRALRRMDPEPNSIASMTVMRNRITQMKFGLQFSGSACSPERWGAGSPWDTHSVQRPGTLHRVRVGRVC